MKALPEFLTDLDEQQRAAVLAPDGPVIVFAGAGSGKTRVLTYRVAYLIRSRGVPPSQILAVTFTNKAADEMRERIVQLIGSISEQMWIGTFHAICARMLRMHGSAMGLPRDFVIFDEDDQRTLIKRIMRELDIATERYSPGAVRTAISEAKVELQAPEDVKEIANSPFSEIVAKVYERYQKTLVASHAVDFDDLLVLAVRMLREHKSIARYYSRRFHYIHVDEYQDINRVQHELVCLLAREHRNVFIVGDDDQAIYGWRRADVKFMLEFHNHFPEAKVFKLERNYRSTPPILDAAYHVIRNNRYRQEKRLWTTRKGGVPLVIYEAPDEDNEALFVVNMIKELMQNEGWRFRDFAVMYRVNAQSRLLEEALATFSMPYRVVGTLRFYERREIKDMLAFLRLLINPHDEVSLLRIINVPPRGIGERTIERLRMEALQRGVSIGSIALNDDEISTIATKQRNALKAFRKLMGELREQMQKKSTAELIDCIVKQTGYDEFLRTEGDLIAQERLDNIRQLMISAQRQFGDAPATQTLHAFLEQLALVTGQDAATWDDDAVTLLTVHSAKGLEFPVVFVVGLEEGLFPHARSMNDERELEEERRLFYVALTRAKDRIFLVRAIRRMTISASGYYQASQFPSRFIDEIPEELKEQIYGQPTLTGFVRSFTVSTEMAKPAVTGIDLKTVLSPSSVGSTLATESQDAFHTSTVARNETAQMKVQFQPGDRVRHDQFGLGTVKSVEPRGKYWHAYVVFDNPDVGEKCLALEYAPMEKVTEE